MRKFSHFILGAILVCFTCSIVNAQQLRPIEPCFQEVLSPATGYKSLYIDDCGGNQVYVSISGPGSVNKNDYDYYYVNVSGGSHYSTSYYVYGGSIISQSKTQVRVRWTSVGSRRYVRAIASTSGGSFTRYRYVTVSNPAPSTPSSISVSTNTCGNKTLTRGNPPSGVTWYWQTSSSGTSTSNSSKNYTLTSSGRRYLRARDNNSGTWSSSSRSSGYITVKPYPNLPSWAIVSVSNHCGYSTIYKSDVAESNNWYWQGTNPNGKSTSNNLIYYNVDQSGTYYLRARSPEGCWSSSRSINVTVNNGPAQPSISSITYDFNGATVTRNNPPSGVTWYWHTSATGESQSNSSPTYLMTQDKNYYLRGIDADGCWGENLVISYRAKEPDVITANTVSYNSIKVSWSGVKGNETGFLISRSDEENGIYVPIHTVSSTDSEYIDSDLEINSTWYYRVQALVNDQKSTGLQIVNASTERMTHIPDNRFRWYLNRNYPYVDTYGEYVITSSIDTMKALYIPNVYNYNDPLTITNMQGIQDFLAVERINLHRHDLSTLDLSNNIQLKHLTYYNYTDNRDLPDELSCIQVSQEMLESTSIDWNIEDYISLSLDCQSIPRTEIPDGQFETILIDEGYDNILDGLVNTDKIENVTSLDILFDSHVSDLTGIEDFISLQELEINDSRSSITRLNLSNNSNLNSIRVFSRTLDCITVSEEQLSDPDIFWQTNKWIAISTTMCDQQTHIPAYQFRKALYDEEWAIYDGSEYVSTAVVSLIRNLDLSDYSINNLKGIEDFTSLEILKCSGCPLSNNSRNSVENLPKLKYLDLSQANLDELDISNLQMLDEVHVTENKWLTCIQVNDAQINDLELIIEKDLHAGLSLDCSNQNLTYIPGGNFEAALIELGYDNKGDNYVVTDVINKIDYLSISNKYIYNLTGIEDFASLEYLNIQNNGISNLDLSKNNNLLTVWSHGNFGLTCILINPEQLSSVSWYTDSFTGLSTEICEDIYIPDNNFEQKLIDLGYDNRQDDYVSLSTIKNVTNLNLNSVQIASLQGIEGFESLEYLNCWNNYLTELNLSQNTNLTNVLVHFNPNLNCIQVNEDQLDYHVSSWYKDENAEWSLDCNPTPPADPMTSRELEQVILSEEGSSVQLTLYPNPANEEIHLIGDIRGAVVHMYDLNGKEVLHEANDQDTSLNLNSSSLKDGIYLMRIELESGQIEERKLVIKH
ncbi:T9SS type A sorting domain-containing protein [Ekhidna sp.]|uniref:T9SS type A sorting domain-containing protein n=1 Tax=Ekhidna sp. TaxID=2608089 RepID=UPI003C7B8DE4